MTVQKCYNMKKQLESKHPPSKKVEEKVLCKYMYFDTIVFFPEFCDICGIVLVLYFVISHGFSF